MSTTITVHAYRQRILDLQRQGKGYQFLSLVDTYLGSAPDDHEIRLRAAREYLDLGLIDAAKELFEVSPTVAVLPGEITQLAETVASLPGGSIPWTRHERTFESNLAAIKTRGVDCDSIRTSWSQQNRHYRLFRDKHGVHQVRRRGAAGAWRWFPYLGNHRAVDDARPFPDDVGTTNMPGPVFFQGVGLGRYFERVYEATLDTFLGYSCALFVAEPDPDVLAVALHLNNWNRLLADPRVHLFLGDDWSGAMSEAWRMDPDLPFPSQVITCSASSEESRQRCASVVRTAMEEREAAIRDSLADVERRYASRDIAYWSRRLGAALGATAPPLRILGAVSVHTTFLQHSMRDAKRALEAVGHRCVVLSERSPYTTTSPLTFHQTIRELDPDLFFVLDHIRPEFHGFIPANLPILTWDQDQLPHVVTKANLARVAKHDFLVGCSKSHCISHGFDPRQYLHARVPTCPEQFGGEPLSATEEARYGCDVSYVSHASQTPLQFHDQEKRGCGDASLSRLLDVMYELLPEQLAVHRTTDGGVMSYVLAEGCRRVGIGQLDTDLEERLRSWYLWRLGDRMFRHEALEWVGKWAERSGRSFRIYGRGWDKHPTLSGFAAGPAENGRELLCIYRASKINLQLMPAGFIHQRSLDGMAARGFFLTRLCPHDLRGRTLRRLHERIVELGIPSTDALLAHSDGELQSLLDEYMGGWLRRMDHQKYDLLTSIRTNAELLYPDETFADFSDIVFDSAEQFAERADRFLGDESARQAVAEGMRTVVVERFSYRPAMRRFLEAMSAYLRQATSETRAE